MQICPPEPFNHEKPLSIIEAKNKIRLGHDPSCNCCCCCSPQPKCLKYIQPEVAKSFAPIRRYWKPNIPMEDHTTYKLSFWEGPINPAEPYHPEDSLIVGNDPMCEETTHKLSYIGNWCVKPQPKINPRDGQLLGIGSIQDVTTQKHDYGWKYLPQPKLIKTQQNLYLPCASMTDDTTYKLSYFNSNCLEPIPSFKPLRKYEKSDVPMEGCTTYRLSYWPNQAPVKEEHPWNLKKEYSPPVNRMDGCTTYKLSYWPHCEKPRKPATINDSENILNCSCCFDDNTTYKLSFFGCGGDKPDLIKQQENILFSRCPLSLDTTNRLSYLGNWCVKPESPMVPCRRNLFDSGPIQEVTTQKHDYTWKCNVPDSGFQPENNITFSPMPLECCTTNRLSYVSNNLKLLERIKPFKPLRMYKPSDVPLDAETTMRLSYQPVEPADQVEKPWAGKTTYHAPTTPLEDNTTYNLSYIPPGTLVPLPPCSSNLCKFPEKPLVNCPPITSCCIACGPS